MTKLTNECREWCKRTIAKASPGGINLVGLHVVRGYEETLSETEVKLAEALALLESVRAWAWYLGLTRLYPEIRRTLVKIAALLGKKEDDEPTG